MPNVRSKAVMWALAATCAFSAWAQAPQAKAKPKGKPAAPMFSVPSFQALPAADGLKQKKNETTGERPKAIAAEDPVYSVVSIKHASAGGAPLTSLSLTGAPPTTERFRSTVRVKCPQKVSAPIEVVLLDARQDTVMRAEGQLTYRANTHEETEYTVDWEPTRWPTAGEFRMLVRVAGQALGSWPLPAEKK
jgi:hypothetical protein